MKSHAAHWIALGFGSGLSRWAPGTAGTLWAWIVYALVIHYFPDSVMYWFMPLSFVIGWWACTKTAEHMGVADPGSIVWDEVWAFWLILWIIPTDSLWAQLIAFALFRFFDALKPGPIAWADKYFKGFGAKGGFGIMWDDVMAAFFTLFVFALGYQFI